MTARGVEIFRFGRAPEKAGAACAIAAAADLAPGAALALVHAALSGARPTFYVPAGDAAARALIGRLAAARFIARFAGGAAYDPARRAEAALGAALPVLPHAVGHACGAWLLAGQWQDALMHALQCAGRHLPAGHPALASLSDAALETGLAAGALPRAPELLAQRVWPAGAVPDAAPDWERRPRDDLR